ncbi:hypothetical protein [Herminiimonas contaminans]|uniref:Tail fiber domain-containing protein n=1 Tax=Herminiimonas contaminans TaxID=1111140 RepID=A0ABS0ES80_9BURK|nr:hypothetical protein [Herminiimonas contaminans]MBF8177656.1 hypothetical protein [Herminiimonas contaminans]
MGMKHIEEPIYWSPLKKGRGWICFKSSPAPPPAPDYAGAAQQTAAGNLDAARAAAAANRVNQVTPYGNLTYSRDPNGATPDDGWTATQTLSPVQQQLLDQQNKTSLGLSGLTDRGLGFVNDALSNAITKDSLPADMVNAGQTGQDALMARFQPQIDQSRKALETQLANQGIGVGSEAYDNAMRTQSQSENDLKSQAALNGINVGQNAQNQQLQLLTALQNQPLNILNAVRSGSQVTNPTFSSVPTQATTSGADMSGATAAQGNYAQGLYNSGVASANSANSSLMSTAGTLGAAGLAAYLAPATMMF